MHSPELLQILKDGIVDGPGLDAAELSFDDRLGGLLVTAGLGQFLDDLDPLFDQFRLAQAPQVIDSDLYNLPQRR